MRALSRTDLPTSEKVYLAAASVAMSPTYGAISELGREHALSRPTLYALAQEATALLEAQLQPQSVEQDRAVLVQVDRRQLERAAVALRCISPTSVPAIVELLPILYPGLEVSYGKLWGLLSEAERRAGAFNAAASLEPIGSAALDELYSQGHPVLSALDLDSGYVFALQARASRSAADWSELLQAARGQGLELSVAVKDAASGIAAALREVFPAAQQRDDCFHAVYEMHKVLGHLERRAYAAIEQEERAFEELEARRSRAGADLRAAAQRWRRTSERCNAAMEHFDRFEAACRAAQEALEPMDVPRGLFRGPLRMKEHLSSCAEQMLSLPHRACRKAGRYLKNRIEGLVLYNEELHQKLLELGALWPMEAVRHAALLYSAASLLHSGRQRWCQQSQMRTAQDCWLVLRHKFSIPALRALLCAVEQLFLRRHRASSAIEGFNAALRPHLYVHKGVSQGFLELFRAYYNLRPARSGRHKGSSAYERLRGQSVQDWLAVLGYPPSASRN
jgi:hypothetical protein